MPSLEKLKEDIEIMVKGYPVDCMNAEYRLARITPLLIAEIEAWHLMAATQHCFMNGSASKQDLDAATSGLTKARQALEQAP